MCDSRPRGRGLKIVRVLLEELFPRVFCGGSREIGVVVGRRALLVTTRSGLVELYASYVRVMVGGSGHHFFIAILFDEVSLYCRRARGFS